MIRLLTQHSIAENSPDHYYPQGTKNIHGGPEYTWKDNYNPFVDEVISYFDSNMSVLDLGAASGCLVDDFIVKGIDAVGLEGSDWPIKNNRENWTKHKDRLFTCDISKPFSIQEDSELKKFDLITAWEVIEHLPPDELGQFADNVYHHLKDNGIFCFSLSPWFEPSVHDSSINLHLSYKITKKEEWRAIFNKFEFIGPVTEKHDSAYHYIFKNRYRGKVRGPEGEKHTFWSTLKKIV